MIPSSSVTLPPVPININTLNLNLNLAFYIYKHCLSNNSRRALGYVFLCGVPPVSMLNSFVRMFREDYVKFFKLAW